jgi:hypothetical protein
MAFSLWRKRVAPLKNARIPVVAWSQKPQPCADVRTAGCSGSTTPGAFSALLGGMPKRVRLTCKCGTSYMLNTILDFPNRCANERCRAVPHMQMSDEELWEYQESLIALMAAIGLSRDYEPELSAAQRISRRLASFHRVEIV